MRNYTEDTRSQSKSTAWHRLIDAEKLKCVIESYQNPIAEIWNGWNFKITDLNNILLLSPILFVNRSEAIDYRDRLMLKKIKSSLVRHEMKSGRIYSYYFKNQHNALRKSTLEAGLVEKEIKNTQTCWPPKLRRLAMGVEMNFINIEK
tara:strand:+ start:677 stop:1120 length:444 start_codon:yes stop_codon:yes gene_type:complete